MRFPVEVMPEQFDAKMITGATTSPDGRFVVTTRRGKQFNTMIHEAKDSLTGAVRDTVFLSRADADRSDGRLRRRRPTAQWVPSWRPSRRKTCLRARRPGIDARMD